MPDTISWKRGIGFVGFISVQTKESLQRLLEKEGSILESSGIGGLGKDQLDLSLSFS